MGIANLSGKSLSVFLWERLRELEIPDRSHYFPQNHYFLYDDRLVIVVFRLKAKMAIFLVKSFCGSRVVYQGDDDFPISCDRGLFHDHDVPIKNTGIDHTVPLDGECEQLAGIAETAVKGDISFDLLDRGDGGTSRYVSQNRDARNIGIGELDGPVMVVQLNDQPFFTQLVDIPVHGRGRFDIQIPANLPDSWGKIMGDPVNNIFIDQFGFLIQCDSPQFKFLLVYEKSTIL